MTTKAIPGTSTKFCKYCKSTLDIEYFQKTGLSDKYGNPYYSVGCRECRTRHHSVYMKTGFNRRVKRTNRPYEIPDFYQCGMCMSILPNSDFGRITVRGVPRLCRWCKKCWRSYRKSWLKKHPGYGDIHHDPEARRAFRISKEYGIDIDEYNRLLDLQSGVCAICSRNNSSGVPLSVDHDHITGRVRGLLCLNCNSAIGQLDDSPELIESALIYLTKEDNG